MPKKQWWPSTWLLFHGIIYIIKGLLIISLLLTIKVLGKAIEPLSFRSYLWSKLCLIIFIFLYTLYYKHHFQCCLLTGLSWSHLWVFLVFMISLHQTLFCLFGSWRGFACLYHTAGLVSQFPLLTVRFINLLSLRKRPNITCMFINFLQRKQLLQ